MACLRQRGSPIGSRRTVGGVADKWAGPVYLIVRSTKYSLGYSVGRTDVVGDRGGRGTSWERGKGKNGEDKCGARSQIVYLPETSPVDYTKKCLYYTFIL